MYLLLSSSDAKEKQVHLQLPLTWKAMHMSEEARLSNSCVCLAESQSTETSSADMMIDDFALIIKIKNCSYSRESSSITMSCKRMYAKLILQILCLCDWLPLASKTI